MFKETFIDQLEGLILPTTWKKRIGAKNLLEMFI